MNAFTGLKLGWTVARRRKRAILTYWLFHTLLALAAAVPLAGLGISLAAKTKYGGELLGEFDLMFLFEAARSAGSVEWAAYLAVPLILLLIVVAVYLAGGAFHVLRRTADAYSAALFWEGAGLHFWRFLRVSFYSVLAWIPFLLLRAILSKATDRIWGEGMEGRPIYIAGHAQAVLLLLCAGYALAVTDFTRARIAAEGTRRVFGAILRTMRFVAARPFLAMGPWAVLGAMLWFLTWLYLKFANLLPAGPMPLVILLIIVQQAYVLARVFLRFAGWGAVIAVDAAARGEHHEPEQEVFSHVAAGGGDGGLRAGAEADPEAEGSQAG